MVRYAHALGRIGVVHAFDYPYMKAGRRSPDRLPKLIEAHAAELATARKRRRGKVVLIGKSMGGRVGCHVALEQPVDAVICLGYPLKGMGKQAAIRSEVLEKLRTPILFVQGTRDNLCPLDLLAKVRKRMTAPNELYVVESGNHSLECTKTHLKQTGSTQEEVEAKVLEAIARFVAKL
jgi:predicted alpha/beta-hydrolase family hydrolase